MKIREQNEQRMVIHFPARGLLWVWFAVLCPPVGILMLISVILIHGSFNPARQVVIDRTTETINLRRFFFFPFLGLSRHISFSDFLRVTITAAEKVRDDSGGGIEKGWELALELCGSRVTTFNDRLQEYPNRIVLGYSTSQSDMANTGELITNFIKRH